jgi:deoxyribonuclease V
VKILRKESIITEVGDRRLFTPTNAKFSKISRVKEGDCRQFQFAAIDVGYFGNEALAAAVLFSKWEQGEADLVCTSKISGIVSYASGEFYLRELPCILAVLKKLNPLPNLVIVDGYVCLDESLRPGLGAHLHDALRRQCAVVGVAKSCYFKGRNVAEVMRGRSRKPLFVTSVGVDIEQAARGVRNMHGKNRIPTLLAKADRLSRSLSG